jgi:hypothetical protein
MGFFKVPFMSRSSASGGISPRVRIVTGSHGRTGLERVLLGSSSGRILNETPCAVLVVKVARATAECAGPAPA